MAKPWTKKAHEKKALKTAKKNSSKVDTPGKVEPKTTIDAFVGSIRKLLRQLDGAHIVLIIDLKRNKIVFGPFPSGGIDEPLDNIFEEYTYNGKLVSLEGAALLKFIYKDLQTFFGRLFFGMNGLMMRDLLVVKTGLRPIRNWDFIDEQLNPYGNKSLEDYFGSSNNWDQLIFISQSSKAHKALRRVFYKISPDFVNSKTAIDAEIKEVKDYSIDRIKDVYCYGNNSIRFYLDPIYNKKCRIADWVDILDKSHLDDKGNFVTSRCFENYGFDEKECRRLLYLNSPLNLEEVENYLIKYLKDNPKPDYTVHNYRAGEVYYDHTVIESAFIEYLRSQLN